MNKCNGTTHVVCSNRLKKMGGKSQCCVCVVHDNCNLNNWEEHPIPCEHTLKEASEWIPGVVTPGIHIEDFEKVQLNHTKEIYIGIDLASENSEMDWIRSKLQEVYEAGKKEGRKEVEATIQWFEQWTGNKIDKK